MTIFPNATNVRTAMGVDKPGAGPRSTQAYKKDLKRGIASRTISQPGSGPGSGADHP